MRWNRQIVIARIVLSCTIFGHAQTSTETRPSNGSTFIISAFPNDSSVSPSTIPSLRSPIALHTKPSTPLARALVLASSAMASPSSTPTTNSDPDVPHISSPVPILGGCLAVIIIIVVIVLVIFLVRRQKRGGIAARRGLQHPPHLSRSVPEPFAEGLPHSISPSTNAGNHFLMTPPSPTLHSPPSSPTTSTKRYPAKYSISSEDFSSEDLELNRRGSAPRVVITEGRGQPHRHHTPRQTHSHRPQDDHRTAQQGGSASASQSVTPSASTTVTTNITASSGDASQLRYPIDMGNLDRKTTPSDSDPLRASSITITLPSSGHSLAPNAPPLSEQSQSSTRQPQPALARLPDQGESPPAYDDIR